MRRKSSRLRTPNLSQIAELIDSVSTPQEKLAVELSAFSGVPWRSVLAMRWDQFEWLPQTNGDVTGAQSLGILNPLAVFVQSIDGRPGESNLTETFLCDEGCELLCKTMMNLENPHLLYDRHPRCVFHGVRRSVTARVRQHLRKHELGQEDILRQYFVHSLADAQIRGETSLTDWQLSYMLGYHNELVKEMRRLYRGRRWKYPDIRDYLRAEYRKIEPAYFSTVGFPKRKILTPAETEELHNFWVKEAGELGKANRSDR